MGEDEQDPGETEESGGGEEMGAADGSEPSEETETGDPEPGDTDTGDPDTGELPTPYDYTIYPLVDGATWTYIDKNANGQVLGMEIVEAAEIEWDGELAWTLTDSPNQNGEWTEAIIVRDGDMTMRVHKEISDQNGVIEIVDYDPGFTRANDAWIDGAIGFTEELLYERTEYDGQGQNPSVEPRGHWYTIVDTNVEVEVPAGVFDCVEVERVRSVGANIGELAVFWYAPGIGKVREERPAEGEVEELASVSIPGGVELP